MVPVTSMKVPSHCVLAAAPVDRCCGASGGLPLDTTEIEVKLVISIVVKKMSTVPVKHTTLPVSCRRGSLAVVPKTLIPRPDASWMYPEEVAPR